MEKPWLTRHVNGPVLAAPQPIARSADAPGWIWTRYNRPHAYPGPNYWAARPPPRLADAGAAGRRASHMGSAAAARCQARPAPGRPDPASCSMPAYSPDRRGGAVEGAALARNGAGDGRPDDRGIFSVGLSRRT